MIKKKLNIYLLLSLALLFISLLGTTSFAKTVTENEIRNFIYNAGVYNNKVWTETQLQSLQNYDFSSWVATIENNESRWILTAGNPNWYQIELFSYTGNATNLSKHGVYKSSNRLYVNSSYLTKSVKGVSIFGDVIAFYPSDMYETNFMYTDCNIYNTTPIANATILTSAGTYRPNNSIFDGPFRDDSFEIDINADFRNNKATISNDTSGTEYYLIPYNNGRIRIGNMFDYSNLAGVVKRKFRYKQSLRDFELIQEFESNTNNLDYYSIVDDTLVVYEYFQGDTTEFITFIPKEGTGFNEFTIPIYFVTDNTRIVNGVIDGDSTFSGDYYSNYNNDTNTDKVIDNTNNGNDVDSILEETLSGDIDSVSGQLGFSALDNPFTSFLFFVIDGVYDILTQSGNVVLQANYKNYLNFRLESNDFITPNGPLKTFIRDMLICVYIYGNYKYFHYLITLLETARINKFMAEIGTDEFYDTDIM